MIHAVSNDISIPANSQIIFKIYHVPEIKTENKRNDAIN